MTWQVVGLCGSRGLTPVAPLLKRMRQDFPLHVRLCHFPSLLWISSSDRAIQALPLLGSAGALLAIYGGPYARWGLLTCFIVGLSLDRATGFVFPWDCVLMEM